MSQQQTKLTNFIRDVHPDPDHLLAKSVDVALPELSRLVDHFMKAIGKTHCMECGNPIEEKLRKKRIKRCSACFTSNA